MRIIVFGTGYVYEKNKHRLTDFDVILLIDNDKSKMGKKIDGIIVDLPQNHYKYNYNASCYYGWWERYKNGGDTRCFT